MLKTGIGTVSVLRLFSVVVARDPVKVFRHAVFPNKRAALHRVIPRRPEIFI